VFFGFRFSQAAPYARLKTTPQLAIRKLRFDFILRLDGRHKQQRLLLWCHSHTILSISSSEITVG
jgi:hypothetical protein